MFIKTLISGAMLCTALNMYGSVKLYKAPPEMQLSKDYIVKVNNIVLDLYASNTRYGSTASFGYFDFTDSVQLTITAKNPVPNNTGWLVLPEKYGITYKNTTNGEISFWLKQPAQLTFVVNGDYWGRTLHLFANHTETKTPKQNSPGVIYFGPGYHVIDPAKNNVLTIESNQKVYIAGGAVVKGCIKAVNSENIQISGRGILLQTKEMSNQTGIDIEACSGVKLEGIIINRNRSDWTGFIYKSDNITVNDVKVLSPAIWNTDGINLANCANATISNCFIRTGDDNIAIKGLGNNRIHSSKTVNPLSALPNENIHISNCIFWSDNNNAVVLGQETLAEYYQNISFMNCDILFVRDEEPIKAAMSVISLQGTEMYDILFDNIRVGPSGQLVSLLNTEKIFSLQGTQKWPGEIHDVTFRNITATGRGNKTIAISGWDQHKQVHNITFEGIRINGDTLRSDSYRLNLNDYSNTIIIDGDTIKKPILKEPVSALPLK